MFRSDDEVLVALGSNHARADRVEQILSDGQTGSRTWNPDSPWNAVGDHVEMRP